MHKMFITDEGRDFREVSKGGWVFTRRAGSKLRHFVGPDEWFAHVSAQNGMWFCDLFPGRMSRDISMAWGGEIVGLQAPDESIAESAERLYLELWQSISSNCSVNHLDESVHCRQEK